MEFVIPIADETFNLIWKLHKAGYIHRDIKPGNIMLDQNLEPKLADFGCVQMDTTKPLLYQRGTLYYVPPELQRNGLVIDNRPGDIWSLGILLFTMVTSKLPWRDTSEAELIEQVKSGHLTFPIGFPELQAEIIKQCCAFNPADRITTSELLKNKWVWDPRMEAHALNVFGGATESCSTRRPALVPISRKMVRTGLPGGPSRSGPVASSAQPAHLLRMRPNQYRLKARSVVPPSLSMNVL